MRRKDKISKRRTLARISILVLLFLSAFFFVASRYKTAHFGDAKVDEILFYLMNGAAEGQTDSLVQAAKDNLLLIGIVFFLMILPVVDFYRNRITIKIDLSFIGKKKIAEINPSRIRIKYKVAYAVIVFILSSWLLLNSFGVFDYIRSLSQKSTIYEDHFVDPRETKLTFPAKKKNLVYIYLESMENTVASRGNGGQANKSIIPELEQLALDKDNVSFSNQSSGLGGALPAIGTTWTVGGIVAQSSGLPLKTSVLGQDHNQMGIYREFLPGAYTLGDILQEEGYNQSFVMGSEASFGGRDKLLDQHGDFMIQDLKYAKEKQLLDKDYHVWWGYEDKKLFDYGKAELERLSQIDKPFNFQMLTADTHFTDGYLDPTCATDYPQQYDNVHACSSKRVAEFIGWIQDQPFAKNTVIVVSGDHLGMQTSYYEELITDPNYQRTIYNLFINSSVNPAESSSRLFTSFDMFPSTLAAMGVGVEGNRLGLGVNLFSTEPTLLEQYGNLTTLNTELSKYSEFYEKRIFQKSN